MVDTDMKNLLNYLFHKQEKKQEKNKDQRQIEYLARQQFLKLKEKGLSIPIVTL